MTSPFPGMDLYIEGPLWLPLHVRLATEVADQLNPLLRPRYFAVAQQRFILTAADEVVISTAEMISDVALFKTRPDKSDKRSRSGKATILAAPLKMATVVPVKVPHTWVEIRDAARRRLVTVVEFLSPVNKRGIGRKQYLRKRRRILLSSTPLVEIDLLRKGRRVPMSRALPDEPYFVFLSRAGNRPETDVWPIALDQPLPAIPIPLLGKDHDVPLDLQQTFAQAYERCGCDLLIDYSRPPEVPLPPQSLAWVKRRLKAAGKTPGF